MLSIAQTWQTCDYPLAITILLREYIHSYRSVYLLDSDFLIKCRLINTYINAIFLSDFKPLIEHAMENDPTDISTLSVDHYRTLLRLGHHDLLYQYHRITILRNIACHRNMFTEIKLFVAKIVYDKKIRITDVYTCLEKEREKNKKLVQRLYYDVLPIDIINHINLTIEKIKGCQRQYKYCREKLAKIWLCDISPTYTRLYDQLLLMIEQYEQENFSVSYDIIIPVVEKIFQHNSFLALYPTHWNIIDLIKSVSDVKSIQDAAYIASIKTFLYDKITTKECVAILFLVHDVFPIWMPLIAPVFITFLFHETECNQYMILHALENTNSIIEIFFEDYPYKITKLYDMFIIFMKRHRLENHDDFLLRVLQKPCIQKMIIFMSTNENLNEIIDILLSDWSTHPSIFMKYYNILVQTKINVTSLRYRCVELQYCMTQLSARDFKSYLKYFFSTGLYESDWYQDLGSIIDQFIELKYTEGKLSIKNMESILFYRIHIRLKCDIPLVLYRGISDYIVNHIHSDHRPTLKWIYHRRLLFGHMNGIEDFIDKIWCEEAALLIRTTVMDKEERQMIEHTISSNTYVFEEELSMDDEGELGFFYDEEEVY